MINNQPPHPTLDVTIERTQEIIEIDVLLVPLVKMFNNYLDIPTIFCCQGDDLFSDPTVWEGRKERAYIMFSHNDESHAFILEMIRSLHYLQIGRKSSWDIKFDHHVDQGHRVVIRFPQAHIPDFEKFTKKYIKKLNKKRK